MTQLIWDNTGERLFETGVDRGVLYTQDVSGAYANAFVWNGLTTVTESPDGAESNPQYADNIQYLNLLSAENFGGTIEAFTYPAAFAACDGTATPTPGVAVNQQARKVFGLAYRTKLGNDLLGADYGYKIHLVYGALAAPSEKAYSTINDSPEALALSWEFTTTPVPVTGLKPSASLVIDSTKVTAAALTNLENTLYGTAGTDGRLPLPDEVIGIISAVAPTTVRLTGANQPTYVSGTHVVTLPNVTGVQWKVNGVNKAPGAQPALTTGQSAVVTAVPSSSAYVLTGDTDYTFDY